MATASLALDAPLQFGSDGAQRLPGAAASQLATLFAAIAHLPADRAGVRTSGDVALGASIDGTSMIGRLAAALLGRDCCPVRAILFDKCEATNWALGWHQDRTIAVRERVDVPGFGPWTVKQGMTHVEPPFALIERMVTLRIHLDAVPTDNAPLLIAPGSHRLGKLPERAIDNAVATCGTFACLAEAGDVWAYATPILHASERAQRPVRRRVLQVDYSGDALPDGLEWLGV